LAAHATLHNGTLALHAAWGDPALKGAPLIEAKDQCTVNLADPNVLAQATSLGEAVAAQLVSKGALTHKTHPSPN
jgi:hypothetical protein